MSFTSKVFLDLRRQKDDQTFPLKIRITSNRKHKEVPLGISILKTHWNEKTNQVKNNHPNAILINREITQKLSEIQETFLLKKNGNQFISAQEIKTEIVSLQKPTTSFLIFATAEVDKLMRSGRVGNAIAYKAATNKLIKYARNKELLFEQITYNLIDNFSTDLLSEGLSQNAIACYLREIRAIFNKAIKAGVIDAKYYPFKSFRIKTKKTISRALLAEDIRLIAKIDLPENSPISIARDYFMLSFYLIGINFSDLFKLKKENVINDRVVFNRSKTHKVYSIKIHPNAQEIFNKYKSKNGDYLLPIINDSSPIEIKKRISQAIKNTNKYLKRIAKSIGIDKPVTTYYGRYSWANIARKIGYSKEIISQALGHEFGNAVTAIYLDDFDNEVIDNANCSIIDFILNK